MSNGFTGHIWLSAHPATRRGWTCSSWSWAHCKDWAPHPTLLLSLSSTVEHQLSPLVPSQSAKYPCPHHAQSGCSHPSCRPPFSEKIAVYIWEVFLPRADCLCTRNNFACVKEPALLFQDKRNKQQTHLHKVFVICIKFIAQTT